MTSLARLGIVCWPQAASKSGWRLIAWSAILLLLASPSAAVPGIVVVPSEVRLSDVT